MSTYDTNKYLKEITKELHIQNELQFMALRMKTTLLTSPDVIDDLVAIKEKIYPPKKIRDPYPKED